MSWETHSVEQLISEQKLIIGDGYRAKNSELGSVGLPFVRVANVANNRVVLDGADRFPEENLEIVGEKISKPFDVLLTSKGTVGRLIYVKRETPKFVYSPQLSYWRVLDNKTIFSGFLFYWMQSREFFLQVNGLKSQTDMADFVSLSDQRRMKITLPSISEQRAIADVLGSLDDKIELNRRMNATLESMARAVFRQWFVESEEAKGWEVKTVGEVVSVVGGSTPSTTNSAFWESGDIHWVTPKDLSPLQSPILLETNSLITELGLQQISSGLLPVGTVLLSSRAPIGYLAISQIPVAINQGFIAIKCKEEIPNYYMLHWLKENMEAIVGRANGTTFLEISKSNFRPMPIAVPPADKMKTFVELVEPLYIKIVANLRESHTLAALRDALLPRLMSGEVRVKAEKR